MCMYFYQFSILKYPVLLLLSPLFIHQHLWPETEKANCHRIHQSQHGFHGNKNPNLFQGSDTFRFGGANGDRTRDLLVANEALSQLSYGPKTLCYYSQSA